MRTPFTILVVFAVTASGSHAQSTTTDDTLKQLIADLAEAQSQGDQKVVDQLSEKMKGLRADDARVPKQPERFRTLPPIVPPPSISERHNAYNRQLSRGQEAAMDVLARYPTANVRQASFPLNPGTEGRFVEREARGPIDTRSLAHREDYAEK